MEKRKEGNIREVKGVFYFTSIIDEISTGTIIEQSGKTIDPLTHVIKESYIVSGPTRKYLLKALTVSEEQRAELDWFEKEFNVAKQLGEQTPFIVKGLKFEILPDKADKSFRAEALFEYFDQDLEGVCRSGIPDEKLVLFAQQAAEAMEIAHTQKICHLNLNSKNIMCDTCQIKVKDFMLDEKRRIVSDHTIACLPPEVVFKKEIADQSKVDVFAWGIVFVEQFLKKCLSEKREVLKEEKAYATFLDNLFATDWTTTLSNPTITKDLHSVLREALSFDSVRRKDFKAINAILKKIAVGYGFPAAASFCECGTPNSPIILECGHKMCVSCVGKQKVKLLKEENSEPDVFNCIECSFCWKKSLGICTI